MPFSQDPRHFSNNGHSSGYTFRRPQRQQPVDSSESGTNVPLPEDRPNGNDFDLRLNFKHFFAQKFGSTHDELGRSWEEYLGELGPQAEQQGVSWGDIPGLRGPQYRRQSMSASASASSSFQPRERYEQEQQSPYAAHPSMGYSKPTNFDASMDLDIHDRDCPCDKCERNRYFAYFQSVIDSVIRGHGRAYQHTHIPGTRAATFQGDSGRPPISDPTSSNGPLPRVRTFQPDTRGFYDGHSSRDYSRATRRPFQPGGNAHYHTPRYQRPDSGGVYLTDEWA